VAHGNSLTSMVRLLLADSSEVVRAGVRRIVQTRSDLDVVAEAADGREATVKAIESRPDIAIIEIALPVINGIAVTDYLCRRLPTTEVLIFTLRQSEYLAFDALAAGARGYVFKSDKPLYLLEAIESLAHHQPYFTKRITRVLFQSITSKHRAYKAPLSNREHSVLHLIAQGHRNREIGSILGIQLKTVETHRAAIMRKLELPSLAELVRYAIRNRIVEP
jgi:DNA-binding NarL/FixJ family response regulator